MGDQQFGYGAVPLQKPDGRTSKKNTEQRNSFNTGEQYRKLGNIMIGYLNQNTSLLDWYVNNQADEKVMGIVSVLRGKLSIIEWS